MKKLFTNAIGVCCSLIVISLLTTTNLSAQYCTSGGTSPAGDHITNVTFAGIDNTTGATGYSDFTDQNGLVSPGLDYPVSVSMENEGIWTETVTIYIDWDQSETFDAAERYDLGSCTSGTCVNPITGTITVPVTAIPGETRMRVIGKFSSAPLTACGSFTYGEVEDYSITVLSGECTPPNFTFTTTNDCVGDTYNVSGLLNDYGTNAFITVVRTRSDAVPMTNLTLVAPNGPPVGANVPFFQNIPFGVTVSAVIQSQNPICNLTRNFEEEICPAENDEACTATELVCDDVLTDQVFLGATQSVDDACFGSGTGDVWYSFTTDGSEKYVISETSSSDMVVQLYSGTDCGDLIEESACFDFPENFTVTEAGTYYFRVRPYSTAQTHSVSLQCIPFDCPELLADFGTPCDDGNPSTYDDVLVEGCICEGFTPIPGQICEVPLVIGSLPYTTTDNTNVYFDDYSSIDVPPLAPGAVIPGTTLSSSYIGGDDVVYSYTPSSLQSLNITVSNHASWAGVYVFTGCPFASTVGGFTTSSATTNLTVPGLVVNPGTTYYIVISTYPSPQSTTYTLNIEAVPFDCPALQANFGSPCDDGDAGTVNDVVQEDCTCAGIPIAPNDEACTAIALACNDTLVDQSFIGSTQSIDDNCTGSGTGDVWYSFTVAVGQAVQVNEPSFNSVTASLYEGDECGNLTEVQPCVSFWNSFNVSEPGDYYLRVRPYSTATLHSIGLVCVTAIENDDCADAEELVCGNTYTGTTIGAASYPAGQPFCGTSAPSAGNGGAWYTISPVNDIDVTLDLSGSTFDTKLFLYSNTCESLVCVDGDDDDGEGTQSYLEASLTGGTTYYVFVTGYSGNTGNYILNISCVDLLCSPTIESLVAVDSEGTPLECVDTFGSYYLEVTLAGGTQASYNVTAGGSPVTVIAAEGTGIVGPIAGGDATVNAVGSTDPTCSASADYEITACPPPNDEACDAIVLACGDSYSGLSFEGATQSYDDACSGSGTADVWFSFVADGTQTYYIAETETDVVVDLWMGDDCGALTSMSDCVDFGENFTVTAAGTYYFRIRPWSVNTTTYGVALTCTPFDCPGVGNFGDACDDGDAGTVNDEIQADCSCAGEPVAANDEACTATVLNCGDVLSGQSFAGSSQSVDDDCSGTGFGDVWFSFVADGTQTYYIAETETDVVVDLWMGDDCGNLTSMSDCVDFGENFTVTAAGTYYFRIRPWSVSTTTYGVSLTCTPFDCPGVGNIGDACDDGDASTINDELQADCSCAGDPLQENDLPCDAISVSCGSSVSGSTLAANQSGLASPSCAGGSLVDLFYSLDAVPGTEYTVTVNGADYDGVLVLYTGACDGTLTELDCADNGFTSGVAETIVFTVESAQTILIRTYDWSTTNGSFTLDVTCVSDADVTLNGSVTWNSNCGTRAGVVTLYTPNTATVVETYNITVAANGTFTIEDLPVGTYDVIVKVQGYLAKGIQDVVIASGDNSLAVGAIKNGNINNDGAINIFDVSLINAAFNTSVGNPSYNPLADLNCDGNINIFDISILNASFNQSGATAPLN